MKIFYQHPIHLSYHPIEFPEGYAIKTSGAVEEGDLIFDHLDMNFKDRSRFLYPDDIAPVSAYWMVLTPYPKN